MKLKSQHLCSRYRHRSSDSPPCTQGPAADAGRTNSFPPGHLYFLNRSLHSVDLRAVTANIHLLRASLHLSAQVEIEVTAAFPAHVEFFLCNISRLPSKDQICVLRVSPVLGHLT